MGKYLRSSSRRAARGLRGLAAAWALIALPLHAATIAELYPEVSGFFPQADRFGALAGDPPAAPVYRGGELLGYALLTEDVVRIPGYSGRPLNTLVGLDLGGRITGIRIVRHEEPILVLGISDAQLQRFAAQYRGLSVFDRVAVGAAREGYVRIKN